MFTFLRRLFGLRPAEAQIEAGTFPGASPVESAATRMIQAFQGPFEPLFRQGPSHMTLLGLEPEAVPALQFIAEVVRENAEYRQSVLTLLRDPGWRLHLVAAVAVLFADDRADLNCRCRSGRCWSAGLFSGLLTSRRKSEASCLNDLGTHRSRLRWTQTRT
jgi:hypothetical protein